jgi:hypothetical protein
MNRTRELSFPLLEPENYSAKSDESRDYNCAAWVDGQNDAWWWPHPDWEEYYWPEGARRDNTLEAFIEGYGKLNFEVCDTPNLEQGYEKIAVYATGSESPKHVALQLPDGRWTSKLGNWEDVEHATLRDLAGGTYGQPRLFMRRPRQQSSPAR